MTRRTFFAAAAGGAVAQTPAAFRWPAGKRAAVSFSFDDARLSQVDAGLAVLEAAGVKATFYLSPPNLEKRLDGWKKAVAAGHEIANHSRSHPCTANYRFSATNALEDYTLATIEADIAGANADIARLLGVTPVSFAYPCGQKFVGRGAGVRSYVPVVAKRFESGRGYLDESPNDPQRCDLAQLMGTGVDGLSLSDMQRLAAAAVAEGRWIVFAGHEIGKPAAQSTDAAALEAFCRYAKDPASGIWIGTVAEIARYVRERRAGA